MERELNNLPEAAVRDAMDLHQGELPRLMLHWLLRRERGRAWRRLAAWAVPWGACTSVALFREDSVRLLFVGIAIGMGGTLGDRMLRVMPVKVRVAELFGRCIWEDPIFWLKLPDECGDRRFAKQLQAHGSRALVPKHPKALAWSIANTEDLSTYPAGLLRSAKFAEAGVRAWVVERTGGSLEMAHTLCTHPEVRTLGDLVRLIERLGRKTSQTPAP